ncbi:MAG: hypothetical protein C4523_15065 [Myxococcales bacterium]|nr:MAG: hypothetical protein C4523_15065 [Myxococcales bacterium]
MQVRQIRLDRIASVTRSAKLPREVMVGDEIVSEEGSLLAVRILNNKYSYNTVEDIGGRMIGLRAGDVLAGALGYRMALKGYAGVVPERLAAGDTIQVLNLGGVLGRCTSANPELGEPFDAEVLGAILAFPALGDRIGKPARVEAFFAPANDALHPMPPIAFVAGTSMNCGKTAAATEIVRLLSHRGWSVGACKLTGVGLRRDILAMSDAGASAAYDFTDAGVVSTRKGHILPVARTLLNRLAADKPDAIVAELGDGILGDYGVSDILADPELMAAAACHLVCAPDPVAVYGAQHVYTHVFRLKIDAFAGPVTDNAVGRDFVTQQFGIPAHNARSDIESLVGVVEAAIERKAARP